MGRSQIIEKLSLSFEKVFQKKIEINETLSAADFSEWDSLANIQLMSQVEEDFNVDFTAQDMMALEKIGDLISFLEKKVS